MLCCAADEVQHMRVMERRYIIWVPTDAQQQQQQQQQVPVPAAQAAHDGGGMLGNIISSGKSMLAVVSQAGKQLWAPGGRSSAGCQLPAGEAAEGEEPRRGAAGGSAGWDEGLRGIWTRFSGRLKVRPAA